ncbi:uncharacterized protein LOC126719173 [Quercus robur]|uniref:uncharacterized protein LOC126719173 n=1 Tax=Quercus robur TaxID=38942 RepID=UPI0021639B69|nr:uncharacterized protein LOC126719173 [Quercus robur]
MNPISSLVFVLLLTVFPTQILCQTALIEEACGYTIYKVLCLETLVPDSEAHSAKELKTLAQVSLKHTEYEANIVDSNIEGLKESSGRGPVRHALVNCSNKFIVVIEKIQAAETSFSQGNVTAAKARLTEATVNRQLCDKGFEGKRSKSPISDWTTKLSQMQNNAESIIYHIQP